MNKSEFEQQYAKRSKLTREQLNQLGLQAEPCDCGEDGCEGYRMVSGEPVSIGRAVDDMPKATDNAFDIGDRIVLRAVTPDGEPKDVEGYYGGVRKDGKFVLFLRGDDGSMGCLTTTVPLQVSRKE